jgi:hypothetical protein
MDLLLRFKWFLWTFGRFKVPMIGYLKPKLIKLNDNEIVIKVALNKRSKNHLNTMYFGALAVGADLAGGLYAFYHAFKVQSKVSVVFKSFQSQFLRRPEKDVFFICSQGEIVKQMIAEARATGERINKLLDIRALINYDTSPEEVAYFNLELSIKVQQ